jgi:tetratricopeptide (TPR) repeat protein
MRVLVEGLLEGLTRFVEQRNDLILLVRCSSNDSASLLAALRNVEQSSPADVFLLFGHDFETAESFVGHAVHALAEQVHHTNEALVTDGEPSLPDLPSSLRERSRAPTERLRDAAAFARSLLPRDGGHRLVWAMCPAEIRDRPSYRALIAGLAPKQGLEPWMIGLRLVFRDETTESADNLSRAPRVHRMDLDLGPAAMEKSLREEAEDERRSEAERFQALLSVALLDSAHGRFADANSKFLHLLGHYQQAKDFAMQAFVINAIGAIYHRTGDLPKAEEWFERAVPPAAEAKQPVILASIVRNLGDVAFERRNYAVAEQYYGQLDALSAHLLDPEGKIRALENRGLALEKLGSMGKAVESWEGAAQLSRSIGLPSFLKTNLHHLERGYRNVRADTKLRAVQNELRDLRRAEESA